MAFQQTSASDWRDLLSVIAAFAVGQGWTKVYDTISTTGQVGLSKDNCHVAIGEFRSDTTALTPETHDDLVNGGTIQDARIIASLGTSLDPNNPWYWGHPGSPQTNYGSTSTQRNWCHFNDVIGPISNVWLFSDAQGDYIHVVAQGAAERYTHFSFGSLDRKGMTHPKPGYVTGVYWTWWPDDVDGPADSTYSPNDIADANNDTFLDLTIYSYHCFIASGTLNPNLGFTDGPFVSRTSMMNPLALGNNKATHTGGVTATTDHMLDYFLAVENQMTTGGVPLMSLPFIYTGGSASETCFMGEMPDVRIVSIRNLNPGQEIKYGNEVWQVFPVKRKTEHAETKSGTNPGEEASSYKWGLAYKKVT